MGFNDQLKEGDRAWNMVVSLETQSKNLIVQRGCFGIMFTNRGDTVANINGIVINPSTTPATDLGDSRSIAGHKNDIYKGSLTLTIATGGTNPLVEVIQLFYTDYQ